ncbi:MAG: rane protease subunit, stomatin/prohibitin [Chthonomonadaceae bacterium]|nr:rane protease subunit, stomatin/prohibitin [Chthonomonadaceae bacterium]
MFNIAFFKSQPTQFVIKYVNGKVRRSGPGIAFYYLKYNTQIVVVPTSTRDADFVFNELTGNFQAITVQGQFTFRIFDPMKAAALLNFTFDPRRGGYVSDDPERLPQRITNIVQMETRREILLRTLEETIRDSQAIAAAAVARIREENLLQPIGVELINLYFLSAKPTPEVAKALEAPYRETMLRAADGAIYARRAAAVDEERKIKENERNTEISLEQRRQELIALQGANAQQEAEFKGKAEETLAEFQARAAEFHVAAAAKALAVYSSTDPRLVVALALKEMGERANKIGNLTITTEMLASLLNKEG